MHGFGARCFQKCFWRRLANLNRVIPLDACGDRLYDFRSTTFRRYDCSVKVGVEVSQIKSEIILWRWIEGCCQTANARQYAT